MRQNPVAARLSFLAIVAALLGAATAPDLAGAQAGSDREAEARALLDRMSGAIAGLDRFVVSGDAYADARLDAGLMIEHPAEVTLRVRRPAEMRLTHRAVGRTREIFLGGGVLTVSDSSGNTYAQHKISGNVEAAIDYAVHELGIDAPLLDFVSKDVAGHLLTDAQGVRYLGTSLIRGRLFEHIAIREPDVDLQVWIAAEGPPLPGKLAISSKWEAGSPRFVVFLEWDTSPEFAGDALTFVAADDAIRIEFDLDHGQE